MSMPKGLCTCGHEHEEYDGEWSCAEDCECGTFALMSEEFRNGRLYGLVDARCGIDEAIEVFSKALDAERRYDEERAARGRVRE